MIDPQQVWNTVLTQLQTEMPRASYETWALGTEALALKDDVLLVATRNVYARDWLQSRLTGTAQRLLTGVLNQSISVQFVVGDSPQEETQPETEETDEPEITIESVQWLDYDRIVQPHKQVVVKGYLRRLGMEIGPKAIWLYIGFHQAAWQARDRGSSTGKPLHSRAVMRFSALSNGAFWRLLKQSGIQERLSGLVQRVDPKDARRFRRGRDGRPHRAPVRYQVSMTPRLTRADATAVHLRLKALIEQHNSLTSALLELLAVEEVMELLGPVDGKLPHPPLHTVMDMVHLETGEKLSLEIERLAQDLHRRIINCLGSIHIPHYFITETIHRYNLTPAQAWLITVARDMAFINSRTGERRDVVKFKRGYQEMSELIGSTRYKTVQAWLHPQWFSQQRGGDLSRFLQEFEIQESNAYDDLRVGDMPRAFRVLLDEPLDADGRSSVDATGSYMADADGNHSRAQMGAIAVTNGSHMVDAHGSALNSYQHPPNTEKKNTATTQPVKTAEAVAGHAPHFWELESLLQQNDVHPKVQKELLEVQASVHAFVSWVLYVASPQSGNLSDPLGYAISRLREHPLREARGVFRQFADLPPAELLALIDATPHGHMNCLKKLNIPLRTRGSRRWVPSTRGCPLYAKFFLAKEPVIKMQLQFLIASEQRASGAMFMESLNDTLLAFVYPIDEKRAFHTFFCPPMRIVALSAAGEVVFDEVVSKWRWVKLPVCRYVLETSPQVDYRPYLQTVLSVAPDLPQQAALDPSLRMDSLLFALLAEAVADIRRIREAHRGEVQPEVQRNKFEVWERGQIVSSAGFILDFSRAWNLPDGAVKLSYSVLQAEEPYLDEIVAASVAGIPWRHEFPNHCMRCGKPASWRPILNPPPGAPTERLWRYQRPENAIPICHHCTETLNLLRDETLQLDLVWGLWGPRFEAFWQWHRARKNNRLPQDWDLYTHPLWPESYGGESWETGSGALKFAEPRPPHHVTRDEQHMQALRRGLYSKKFRGRQPGETPLQQLLDFRLEIPQGESR